VNFREFSPNSSDRIEEDQSIVLTGCDRHRERIEVQLAIGDAQLAGLAQKAADDVNAVVFCFGDAFLVHCQRDRGGFVLGDQRQHAVEPVRLGTD
jgi:hypothetical protein